MEEFEKEYHGDAGNNSQSSGDGPRPEAAERHQYNLSDYNIVDAFIRGAKMRTDRLTRQQEADMTHTIQQGLRAQEKLLEDTGNPDLEQVVRDGRNAEELLVASNALLVVSEARAFMRKQRVLESNLEELVAQGLLGLAIAVRKYTSPDRAKFAAYAKPFINKFMRSADMSVFGSAAYFDRNDRESVLPSLFATNTRMTNQLGQPPTMAELSAEFNDYHAKKRAESGKPVPKYLIMDPERARAMMNIMNPASMNAPVKASDGTAGDTTFENYLPDASEHADTAEAAIANILTSEAHILLMKALESLPEKQRRLLLLTFQFGIDPDEGNVLHDNGNVAPGKIAKLLGIKPQYVSHIRNEALYQLARNPALRDFWNSFG